MLMINLLRNKITIFLCLIAVAIVTSTFLFSGDNILIPSQAKGEVREAYVFAAEHGYILEQVPCYCGCHRSGHKHSRHCFYNDNGRPDNHGLNCGVCVDIALTARDMNAKGSSIDDMRQYLKEKYRGLTPTNNSL